MLRLIGFLVVFGCELTFLDVAHACHICNQATNVLGWSEDSASVVWTETYECYCSMSSCEHAQWGIVHNAETGQEQVYLLWDRTKPDVLPPHYFSGRDPKRALKRDDFDAWLSANPVQLIAQEIGPDGVSRVIVSVNDRPLVWNDDSLRFEAPKSLEALPRQGMRLLQVLDSSSAVHNVGLWRPRCGRSTQDCTVVRVFWSQDSRRILWLLGSLVLNRDQEEQVWSRVAEKRVTTVGSQTQLGSASKEK